MREGGLQLCLGVLLLLRSQLEEKDVDQWQEPSCCHLLTGYAVSKDVPLLQKKACSPTLPSKGGSQQLSQTR